MAYSLTRHIAHAVYFSSYREVQIAMFTAYFDASGKKRMPAVAVAGFVSTVTKWDCFEREWSAILRRNNVPLFHMTDFASSAADFADWKRQTERRKLFVDDLVACIKKNTNKGFSGSLAMKDYDYINARYELSENFGTPFVLCASLCLGALRKWAKRKQTDPTKILVIIEDGDDDKGHFLAVAKRDGVRVIALAKEDAMAFQAADFVAWKNRTAVQNAHAFKWKDLNKDGQDILRSLNVIDPIVQANQVHDRESLLRLCNGMNIPRRRAIMKS